MMCPVFYVEVIQCIRASGSPRDDDTRNHRLRRFVRLAACPIHLAHKRLDAKLPLSSCEYLETTKLKKEGFQSEVKVLCLGLLTSVPQTA